jgi:pSer/pThr/pTyr-binding forkhead associated (FHA) protein
MAQHGITAGSGLKGWLVSRSGPLAGTRFPIPIGTTRIGRAPDNDTVINDATVSLYHVQLRRDATSCRVRDLDSTNGTWLNGERITEAELPPAAILKLGSQGPEFTLVFEEGTLEDFNRTVEISAADLAAPAAPSKLPTHAHEDLLSAAVSRARRMRAHGVGGETMTIMRHVIHEALRHSGRRHRKIGYSLGIALLTVSALGAWRITTLNRDKRAIDAHIQQLEADLQKSSQAAEKERLLASLGDYQDQAENLQRNLLFRLGGKREGDFVTRELRELMAEFGAEVYSIPPEFIERVNYYIDQDCGPERPLIARSLNESGEQLQTIRRILKEEQMPVDLAYIPIVESALAAGPPSAAGAVGPWQFTAATAKAYGLRVDGRVDERKDLLKSTRASCNYLRDLILDFGAGSSVMLALAAYNSGAGKVKQAVTNTVRDPIKQRNFWYLYRTDALPRETREYVPKVFAAMLIGRNARHFGF